MTKNRGDDGKAFSFPRDGRVSPGEAYPRLAEATGGAFAMRQVHQVRGSAPNRRREPGERLRALRLVRGLTLRDVHQSSKAISKTLRSSEFLLPASRLHDFETKNVVPSIHRLYTLASIYGYEMSEFLTWYGIPQRTMAEGAGRSLARA